MDPSRRSFLKRVSLASAALALRPTAWSAEPEQTGLVPKRKLGRTGEKVSILALGGHALGTVQDDGKAQEMVDEAIDRGVTFFDNAWDYHGGRAEELMGRMLKGKRDRVFLMTKMCTHGRDRKTAMQMLEESLTRLGTDHLDLWQIHALATREQVEASFAEDGSIAALEEAKKQGKVRFIGFTGHTDPEVHLAMLARGYAFDTCQLPLSAIEAHSDAFVRRVLPELIKQKIAPLAMKTLLGNARPIRDGVMTVEEGLRYALSLPVATVVTGAQTVEQLRENARIAAAFNPMTEAEMIALEAKVLPSIQSTHYQPYRKWMSYRDGDSLNYV